MDALIHGLAAGGFDGLEPVIGHAAQDLDHLPVAVIAALQLAPDPVSLCNLQLILKICHCTQSSYYDCCIDFLHIIN